MRTTAEQAVNNNGNNTTCNDAALTTLLQDYDPSPTVQYEPELFKHTPCTIEVEEVSTKTKLQALIDTGSALNLIQQKAFDRIQANRKLLLMHFIPIVHTYKDKPIYGVDKTPFRSKGCIRLDVQVGSQSIRTSYLIVNELPTAIIMGVPVLEVAGLVPDVANKQLRSIYNPKLCVPMQINTVTSMQSLHNQRTKNSTTHYGLVRSTTILKPKAEQFLRIQIPHKWYDVQNAVILAQPNPVVTRQYPGCLVSSCIVNNYYPHILIVNTTTCFHQ